MDKEKFARPWSCCANHPDCDIILNMTTSGDITPTTPPARST